MLDSNKNALAHVLVSFRELVFILFVAVASAATLAHEQPVYVSFFFLPLTIVRIHIYISDRMDIYFFIHICMMRAHFMLHKAKHLKCIPIIFINRIAHCNRTQYTRFLKADRREYNRQWTHT